MLKKIPWQVWVALIPAVLIGLNEIRKDGRLRVEVAGAGPVALLGDSPPPDGIRFGMDVARHESLAASAKRIDDVLKLHPGIVVFGFDADPIARGEVDVESAKVELAKLAKIAQRAATVSVIVGYHPLVEPDEANKAALAELDTWWRAGVCRSHKRVRCVSLADAGRDPAKITRALHAAVVDGVAHLGTLRATTQVGR